MDPDYRFTPKWGLKDMHCEVMACAMKGSILHFFSQDFVRAKCEKLNCMFLKSVEAHMRNAAQESPEEPLNDFRAFAVDCAREPEESAQKKQKVDANGAPPQTPQRTKPKAPDGSLVGSLVAATPHST